jgi:hypothetical protein
MSDLVRTCGVPTENGGRCGQRLGQGRDVCVWHDPAIPEEPGPAVQVNPSDRRLVRGEDVPQG